MSDTTPGSDPTPEPAPQAAAEPTSSSSPSTASTSSTSSFDASAATATLKSAHPLDLGSIGAGLVVFIASLLPYYTVSVEVMDISSGASANAWHGFFGWFGALLALAATGILVARLLGVLPALPVPVRTAVLGLFAVATLCTLLALFVTPGGDCDDSIMAGACDMIDQGHGVGYWLALLATIAGTALAALRRSAD